MMKMYKSFYLKILSLYFLKKKVAIKFHESEGKIEERGIEGKRKEGRKERSGAGTYILVTHPVLP